MYYRLECLFLFFLRAQIGGSRTSTAADWNSLVGPLSRCVNPYIHTVTHCNPLQHTATHCNILQPIATHGNALQHTATHFTTLQRTATHCNIGTHVAPFQDVSMMHAVWWALAQMSHVTHPLGLVTSNL